MLKANIALMLISRIFLSDSTDFVATSAAKIRRILTKNGKAGPFYKTQRFFLYKIF